MAVLATRINTDSEAYTANRVWMLVLLDELRATEDRVRALSERAKQRFESRGKLMPRDRLSLLLDRGRLSTAEQN